MASVKCNSETTFPQRPVRRALTGERTSPTGFKASLICNPDPVPRPTSRAEDGASLQWPFVSSAATAP